MSPVQEPVCTTNYPRTRIDAALIRAEFLHPDSFYPGTFLDEEDTAIRKKAENVSQYKLPTYQAAAVVSTVLAGVESQLLVFFKSSPDFTRHPMPVILQYILVLTYIALIFSVSTTINSLILTRYFGNITMLVERFHEKTRSVALPSSEFPSDRNRSREYIAAWGWRLLECHWLFTLVISVLCLPAQILLYIWTQEKCAIRAAVSVAAGHGNTGVERLGASPSPQQLDGPDCNLVPAPVYLPPAIYATTNLATGMVFVYRMLNVAITNFNTTHSHTHLLIPKPEDDPQHTVQYDM